VSRHRALARGDLVDRYVVLEEIGAGGMGVVLAAFDPELDRRVAIKLLRVGRGGNSHAMLMREGQAIAQLSHPNVIAVHDIGRYRDEVFIAMEHVSGESLSQWMDSGDRTWREVVAVFTQAGRGLAAAHDEDIVHRDFKPSNALIGDDGRVRVLDFGLARIFAGDDEQDGGDTAGDDHRVLSRTLTLTGHTAGTPAYMSPEQFDGRTPDARSDIFSFCVALHEALMGEHPFGGDDIASLKANVLAGNRRSPSDSATIPRWLREVVRRGLEVDPADRYASMDELLAELDADRTSRAAPWIAAGLFAGAVAIGLALGLTSDRKERPCRTAPDRVADVWNADVADRIAARFAETNRPYAASTVEQVGKQLASYTDAWAEMHTETCEATEVRHEQSDALMDLRMMCLDGRLNAVAALTQVFADSADGEVVDKAVEAVLGLPPLGVCNDKAALTARVPPPDDPEIRERIASVRATLETADAERLAGRYPPALELAITADAAAAALDYEPIRAEAAYSLGRLYDLNGEAEKAEQHVARAADSAALARDDRLIARTMIALVSIVGVKRNRHAEALELYRAARVVATRADVGPDLLAALYDNVARVHYARAEFDRALELFELERDTIVGAFGDDDPRVARALNGIANTLSEQGKFMESRDILERALEIDEAGYGKGHLLTAGTLNNLGDSYKQLGDYDTAAELNKRAVDIKVAALGDQHPSVAEGFTKLAIAYYNLGRTDEAYDLHKRALAIFEKTDDPGHPRISGAHQNVGLLAREKGQLDEARRHIAASIANTKIGMGDEHPDLAYPLLTLGTIHRDAGEHTEALRHFRQALAIRRKALGDTHPMTAFTLKEMGPSLIGAGLLDEAITSLDESLAVWSELNYHGTTGDVRFLLAEALWAAGRERARAIKLARLARGDYIGQAPKKDAQLADVNAWLAKRGG
jgi:serine/threonine-protein kinase